MNSEHMQILQMVESGDVSVEEAVGLMSDSGKPKALQEKADDLRWLRVRVTDLESGQPKVSVNVPLAWMKWGLALGSRFAPELDVADIDEMMGDLDRYAGGRFVEVEDVEDNQKVEIYID